MKAAKQPVRGIVPVILFALVKFSGIAVVDMRNKLGGTVFTKTKAGAAVRNKVTPVNRRSVAQQTIRALFTSFTQAFRNLTPTQINGWNDLANTAFKTTNIFGDIVAKSGINLYVQLNINLRKTDNATINDAPSLDDVPAPLFGAEPTADVSSANLFVKAGFEGGTTTIPAGNSIAIYATPKLSNGVRNFKSKLKQIGTLPEATDTTTSNILSDYTAFFGPLAVGDNVYLGVQTVNDASGAAGTPVYGLVTISA